MTPSPRGSFPAHKIMINCISIDSDGEHIATCSDDGRVKEFTTLILRQNSILTFVFCVICGTPTGECV